MLVHIDYTLSFNYSVILLEIELLELLKDFDYFHKGFPDRDRYVIPVTRRNFLVELINARESRIGSLEETWLQMLSNVTLEIFLDISTSFFCNRLFSIVLTLIL